jgi:hypothetical protein
MVSRRLALRWSVVLIPALWPAARSSAEQKVSKADARYQERPNGQQRCEICLQFQSPASCNLVEGKISPRGWCQYFAARENAH